jgi:hypothetical protein
MQAADGCRHGCAGCGLGCSSEWDRRGRLSGRLLAVVGNPQTTASDALYRCSENYSVPVHDTCPVLRWDNGGDRRRCSMARVMVYMCSCGVDPLSVHCPRLAVVLLAKEEADATTVFSHPEVVCSAPHV